ncbi:MAG: cation:proton antiporter [Betaproteobacteria bacterium]|nr:cation:proton antiporter [Betaproteobacteria bacterium]
MAEVMMPFFPDFPPPLNEALLLGVLLVIGGVLGAAAQRFRMPAVFGYVLAGFAVGPLALDLPVRPLLEEARVIVDIAVGLVLFELGRRLDLQWLRRDPSLWIASLAESALCFGGVSAALIAFGFPPIQAAVAAAIGIATSPAVVWLVTSDAHAQGQVTDRCLNLVAVNTLLAFLLTTMLVAMVHLEYRAGWLTVVLHPLYLLLGSLAIGIATGFALPYAASALTRRADVHFVLIVAAVLIAVGLATALQLSVFLALLSAGATVRNVPRRFELMEFDLGGGARVLYILLFVITGAQAAWPELQTAGWAAVIYVLARAAGKWLGVMASAPLSPLPWRQTACLGLTLMPMSGMALLLMHDIAMRYPQFGQELASVLLAAIVVFELAGPLALHWALRLSGDVKP